MRQQDGQRLLEEHRALVRRGRARLANADAEDLASEAITRCLNHPAPDGRRGPWLERIFSNLLADHWRSRGRRQRFESDWPFAPQRPDPEETLALLEERRLLGQALPALPPELEQAVRLRFVDECDHRQVAAFQGVAPATARTRIHRALVFLREAVAKARAWLPLPLGGASAPVAVLGPAVLTLLVAAPAVIEPPSVSARVEVAQVAPKRTSRGSVPAPAPPAPSVKPSKPESPSMEKPARAKGPTLVSPPPAAKHFDFEDDEVAGDRQAPSGETIVTTTSASQPSLIEIPSSFVPLIVKSLDDI